MSENPELTVVDESTEPQVTIKINWKALLKKAAIVTGSAVAGAALYAILTAEPTPEDETNEVAEDSTE